MNVLLLKQSDIDVFWSYIDKMLVHVLDKSGWGKRYPIDSLYNDLIDGDLKCWIISDEKDIHGVAITQEIEYPLGKSLLVFQLVGKNMEVWHTQLSDSFDKYAKENGIKWIDACGRPGLGKKYLNTLGYKDLNYHYCKAV